MHTGRMTTTVTVLLIKRLVISTTY
jgi:hypothetical protein